MQKKGSSLTWLLVAVIFAMALTTFVLGDMVTCPWHEIPELGGDGGKNIFTYLYQVLYGKGVWFQGMNYPYGEHIVFTDGQPLLSVFLSNAGFHVSMEIALTILWWLIAMSYVIAIVYCYKILIHYQVRPGLSIIFAGFIVMFSPQLLRITGHYALSYACVLPMLYYWTIQYNSTQKLKYCAWIFPMGVITTFLHPYYAAVALVWVGAYAVGYCFFRKDNWKLKVRHLLPLAGAVLSVFLSFWLVMKATDPITDRPATPFGILENGTHIKDVFSSAYTPVWGYIYEHHIFKKVSTGGEGYNYVGFVVLVAVFISFVLRMRDIMKKRKSVIPIPETGFDPIWLFMAFSVLLFSMGVPFIWHMEWLLKYASLLRQFRTLGRFSWIFYYIITVYGIILITRFFERNLAKGKTALAYTVLLAAIGLWAFEASGYITHARKAVAEGRHKYDVFTSKNEENWSQFLSKHHYKNDDFQAIVVLPFFETGSEKLWLCSNENTSAMGISLGIKAGIQLHLPMVDVMMSRSSWSQAFKQCKIAGGHFADKPMLRELPNNKPFLLLNLDNDTLSPDQQYLFESSDFIGHYLNCSVYACYPQKIRANDQKNHDSIAAILPNLSVGDTCIRNTGPWFVNHFETLFSRHQFFGIGNFMYQDIDSTIINTIPIRPHTDQQLYEFSCWFLLSDKDYKSPSFLIQVLDENGVVLSSTETYTKESADNYNMWFRNEYVFPMPAKCRAVRCWLKNMPPDSYIAMDELMLRPVDALIISKGKYAIYRRPSVMVNNHVFGK